MDVSLPKPDLRDLSDSSSILISVYYFIKNFIGVSNSGQATNSTVTIDSKIQEALDLVKSNLMFAVREEVDVLKEKIDELRNKVNRLELENSILRAHASSEALSLLQKPHQTASSSSQNSPQSSESSTTASNRHTQTFAVYNNDDNNNHSNNSTSHQL
ncbi:protein bunched: class 1/class 3/D/E isoforms-like protein [Dinothrombium tinctorium]|uniref:Protein bunched: class 1/class 3/D/E isoforms-like protein n=1 Tax=Dinothrombium tinctorium TaxID=1965070 RepID=A0A3S3QH39_9ACAR|nr:protein bunched: class 1/class 3/D/E isoforms-like protein [Dinothrombium tinctorium]RWS15402.1 protein bunched: class 1/class 3/D/E isoforms-like protein [Dinothrombium tinctorium]